MTREAFEARLEIDGIASDKLRIHKVVGREAISEIFDFQIDLLDLDPAGLDIDNATGSDAILIFDRGGRELRRIHGMIASVDDSLDADTEHRTYQLRFVPRVFRLTMIETQDIFIDMSIPEIIKSKLHLVGLDSHADFRLVADYPKREFVVQYQESDLAFVSRLAEDLGISFFFDHTGDSDRIVFTDHNNGFAKTEDEKPVGYRAGGLERDVFQLSRKRGLIPLVYVVRDYNYRTPQVDVEATFELKAGDLGGVIEFGAHVKTPEEAARMAKIRGEEKESSQSVFSGKSDLVAFYGGLLATIDEHPVLHKVPLLLTEVTHSFTQTLVGSATSKQDAYSNSFRAISSAQTFRPKRITPRPKIDGVVTGIVDPGPSGGVKSPQIDEQGRYTVRFLFDTDSSGERRASRPLRMAQPHGGANYGMHFPLKPGVEVLIVFVNGDPDRPIIMGSVSNPMTPSPVDNKSPMANRIKTQSGISLEFHDGK